MLLATSEFDEQRDPRPNLARASEALQKALSRNANEAEPWLWIGELRALQARWQARQGKGRSEDFEQAASAFQKALSLAPEREDAQAAFRRFEQEREDWKAASHPARR